MAAAQEEPQSASAIRLYGPRAVQYDSSHHPGFTTIFHNHVTPYLAPGQHILDLACGTGLLTFKLADSVGPTGRVVGIDITPSMLAIAREKLTQPNLGDLKLTPDGKGRADVEVIEHDVADLDGIKELGNMKGKFDGITAASMFVLFQDPRAVLEKWVEYLKPGGFIALDVTHPQNLAFGGTVEKTARRLGVWTLYHRLWVKNSDSLREVMEECGVEVEEVIEVKNQSGAGDQSFGIEEADKLFDEKIGTEICAGFRTSDEVRAKAKDIFREEWEKSAVDGRVPQIDTVFLGIGRKTEDFTGPQVPEIAFRGSCRCGSITYSSRASGKEACMCYCAACRQLSGSGYIAWMQCHTAGLEFKFTTTPSTLKTLQLHPATKRTFCNACGTPISMVYTAFPGETSVSMGSIDEGSLMSELPKIKSHIFVKEKASWVTLPDDGARRWEEFAGSSREAVLKGGKR